jgi:hypothetical protein
MMFRYRKSIHHVFMQGGLCTPTKRRGKGSDVRVGIGRVHENEMNMKRSAV